MTTTKQTLTLTAENAKFLLGIGGRNVGLINTHAGVRVQVKDSQAIVTKRARATNYDPDLARRMVLSACAGGVVKWFSTPHATSTKYPEPLRAQLNEQCVSSFGCSLQLLRARSGHMCLMLVPADDASVKNVPDARESVLARLGRAMTALEDQLIKPALDATC